MFSLKAKVYIDVGLALCFFISKKTLFLSGLISMFLYSNQRWNYSIIRSKL